MDAEAGRRHTAAVVVAVSAANLALTALVWRFGGIDPLRVPLHGWHPHPLVLAVMFGVTEAVVLHIQLRRETQAVSLSEIPLVLGLLYAAPLPLLAARLAGSAVVLVGYRRQPRLKVLYNVTMQAAEISAAVWIFHTVAAPSEALTARAVVGAYAAVVSAALLAGWALCTVLGYTEGTLSVRRYLHEIVDYPPIALGVATFGFVAAYALGPGAGASWALLATLAGLLLGYRRYGRLQRRHESLERLFRFARSLPEETLAGAAPQRLMQAVYQLFHADYAALVLAESAGAEPVVLTARRSDASDGTGDDRTAALVVHRRLLTAGDTMLLARPIGRRALGRPAAAAAAAPADAPVGLKDAMAVLLRDGSGVLGSLVVGERVGDVQTFTQDDLQLLQTVGGHVAAAVRNAQLFDRLRYDAGHDALTGLVNRVAWETATRQTLVAADWEQDRADAVVLVDLDGFKDVNDTLGHHHGDDLLVQVARRIETAVGQRGTVGRFGGDEFVVLVPGCTRQEVLALASVIATVVQHPVVLGDVQIEVQASAGIALAPAHGVDVGTLLKRADLAMYSSKRTTSRVTVFHDSLEDQGPNRLALMADLRRALQDGDITIAVQPKAVLPDGDVIGVEALARWQHPAQGPVDPELFIALAERSGMIGELTTSILDQALRWCAAWRAEGMPVSVAVNLSPRALLDDDLLGTVTDALRRHQVPAHQLTLEITESSVIADPEAALVALHALRRLGVRLSVDDFGTGYSSLSYLKRLPVQEVKIDRSFVRDLVHDPDDELIVRAVTDLGRSLHLEVVAEGVEDRATWERLRELGSIGVQGYYLSRPMPPAGFATWLRRHRATSAVSSALASGLAL